MGSTGTALGVPREVAVPGRGRLVVHDAGPRDAHALVLLHGVGLNAELNWSGVVPILGRHHRVLTLDLPGHGRSAPRSVPFRLEDCADDAVHVAAALGVRTVVPVGFSMGGLIAQLIWYRHPDRTAGLVLCSTARNVAGSPWERSAALMLPGLVAAAAWVPALYPLGADVLGSGLLDGVTDPVVRRWGLDQMRRTPLIEALSAVQAACRFTSHRWVGDVDVPTAVVVTAADRVLSPHRQRRLAHAIPGSVTFEIDAGHGVFLDAPGMLAATLLAAAAAVLDAGAGRVDSAS